jgi:hypothetical protein
VYAASDILEDPVAIQANLCATETYFNRMHGEMVPPDPHLAYVSYWIGGILF